jgi:FkbM family methyltransferase
MKILNPWIQMECAGRGIAQAAIPTHLMPSFSQFHEDLVIEAVLASHCRLAGRSMASIRYVEVGANHPIQTSNTYLLYAKHGARGVLVEANPHLIADLERLRAGDRILQLAVAPRGVAQIEINLAASSELSSADKSHMAYFGDAGRIVETIAVQAIALDDLLAAVCPAGCDLLTIDIEGLDLPVLDDASFAQVRPRFLMVEHNRAIVPGNDAAIVDAASRKAYRLVAETQINLLFESIG